VISTSKYRIPIEEWPPVEVRVWGDLACFTRPELKVERASYPVMTPSAARSILGAICGKPEFEWVVREIWVLREIAWLGFMRNEVSSKAVVASIRGWGPGDGFFADDPSERAQRNTLALRDVAYLIRADVAVADGLDPVRANAAKYREMFRRRVERGSCHRPPFLGCREFAAHFGKRRDQDRPINLTQDLGRMLLGVDRVFNGAGEERRFPRFFEARLESGVLKVPIRMGVR